MRTKCGVTVSVVTVTSVCVCAVSKVSGSTHRGPSSHRTGVRVRTGPRCDAEPQLNMQTLTKTSLGNFSLLAQPLGLHVAADEPSSLAHTGSSNGSRMEMMVPLALGRPLTGGPR